VCVGENLLASIVHMSTQTYEKAMVT